MIGDACRTRAAVGVYCLPKRSTPIRDAGEALYAGLARRCNRQDLLSRILFSLVDAGLVASPRDYEAVHRVLRQRRAITSFPGDFAIAAGAQQRLNEVASWQRRAVERVKGLFHDDD